MVSYPSKDIFVLFFQTIENMKNLLNYYHYFMREDTIQYNTNTNIIIVAL